MFMKTASNLSKITALNFYKIQSRLFASNHTIQNYLLRAYYEITKIRRFNIRCYNSQNVQK